MTADIFGGPSDRSHIRLPKPSRITLRNFSLFDHAPIISAEFGNGVFCLAGANGLGKSTFLAALNFAITGIVADQDRRFESVPEYYRYSVPYSSEYFRGRIATRDNEIAEVELEMDVGDRRYRLVRGMFEPISLRQLSITNQMGEEVDLNSKDPAMADTERHQLYTRNIAVDAGLDSFAQLVFLQHFVLTFDERRHLLFWDNRVAQSALFMAFGLDLERARRADTLRRNYERADSLVRNLQWQATEARKRSEDLEATLQATNSTQDEFGRVADQHQALLEEREALAAHAAMLDANLSDASLQQANETAQRDADRAEYEFLFRRVMAGRNPPATHAVISESVRTSRCAICGTDSSEVAARIIRLLDASVCPLCESDLHGRPGLEDSETHLLRELDARLAERELSIADAHTTVARISENIHIVRTRLLEFNSRLAEFERANEMALIEGTGQADAVRGVVDQYRRQIAELQERKSVELAKRNDARNELKELQDGLARAYAAAEDEFVPRFTNLAREFLGLDLSVRLEVSGPSVQLVLSVMNSPRRAHNALSESQRFFIDIALRMALVQQLAGHGNPGALYIDTPEGSLDIAYESRAGRMFGLFVDGGYQLIMTANINSSRLLRKLAATCGSSRMILRRMTDWTSLSEVQSEAEDMFDEAYNQIEAALENEA